MFNSCLRRIYVSLEWIMPLVSGLCGSPGSLGKGNTSCMILIPRNLRFLKKQVRYHRLSSLSEILIAKFPVTTIMAHKRNTRDEVPQDSGSEAEEVLAKRFGGLHTGTWVDRLPSSWIPYVQLARLSPPVPVLLIYFPHLFGIALNAVARQPPLSEVLRISLLLLGGSFFLSNAIHGWNDLIDAPIDKLIPRTRNRPIPRGAISPTAALYFTISQAIGAALFLFLLPYDTALCTIPSVVSHTYYPFAKRHTYFPQVVLAVSLQWAIMVGNSAMGGQWTDKPALYLFLGAMLWTVIYDTRCSLEDGESQFCGY
ncbi:UbiA prenyltransferase family-domain-containing protein [Hypomontagnella monticulosa]|nr:UbiA prenyltransferase family-domain-containing protein [Hypomontagnella monticulosa]